MIDLARLAFCLNRVFEGCKLVAYLDSVGVWTIGIGHTRTAKEGMVITEEQALQLYAADADPVIALVKDLDRPLLEKACLVSFGFNAGTGALQGVLDGTKTRELWIKARNRKTGKLQIEPGLVARRGLETALIEVARVK